MANLLEGRSRMHGGWPGLIVPAALLLAGSLPAQGQEPIVTDVLACVSIPQDEARLDCYDSKAGSAARKLKAAGKRVPDYLAPALHREEPNVGPAPLSPAIASSAGASAFLGDWRHSRVADGLDDKSIVEVSIPATTTSLQPHRRPAVTVKSAWLTAVCYKGETRVYVSLDNELVGSHRVEVDYRLDQEPPVKRQHWSASQDSTAVGHWGSAAIPLARKLAQASRSRIRSVYNVFGQLDADFNIAGSRNAIGLISKACGWKI